MRYFSKRLVTMHLISWAAIVTCLMLSNWQWSRAHYIPKIDQTNRQLSFNELSPLRDFLPPTSVGIKTSISGTWQPNSRMEFTERPTDGSLLINPNPGTDAIVSWAVPIGKWVLDVVTLSDGSSVGVVHGWANAEDLVPEVSGAVDLVGVMQPSESASAKNLFKLPNYISTSEILKKANSTLHDGYFVASTATSGLEVVKPIFDAPQKASLHWRNVIYTGNWIVFALIIFGMWWRIIQEETKAQKESS